MLIFLEECGEDQAVGILMKVQGDREGRTPEEPRTILLKYSSEPCPILLKE